MISWEEIKDIAGWEDKPSPLRDGTYPGRVVSCENKRSRTSDSPMFVITIDVNGTHMLPLYLAVPDGSQAAAYATLFLQRMKAVGIEPHDMIGHLGVENTCRLITQRAVRVQVQVQMEEWHGEMRSKIVKIVRDWQVSG